MTNCRGETDALAGLEAELQAMILEDAAAVSHALVCPRCESKDIALHALALAGWEESDFWAALDRRGGAGV